MANDLIPTMKPAIEAGYNILLTGLHGIGKTYAVMQAVEDLGWKMKYYSTSTLDPYVDLVGVPVPTGLDSDDPELRMVRPKEINEVEVIFFDELNRADPKTLNAVFEIIQFRTINGEPLPKLKCVIGACNPADGDYNVDELDPALLDRFHVYYNLKPKAPRSFLLQNYDKDLVDAFIAWWNNHNNAKREYYISPRRLEYMIDIYSTTSSLDLLKNSIPESSSVDFSALTSRIAVAEGRISPQTNLEQEFAKPEWWTQDTVRRHVTEISEFIEKNPNDPFVIQNSVDFFKQRIGAQKIAEDFGEIMIALHNQHPTHLDQLKTDWGKSKTSQVRSYLRLQGQRNNSYESIVRGF